MEFSSNENYQAFRDNDSSDNRSSFQSSKKDYNSQQRKRFTWKCVCFARKACSSLLFFIIWAAIFIVSYPDVNNNIIYSISGSTPFKIVLFGDSLVNVGCLYFDLAEKLQHQFPNYPLTIVNAGVNNDMIADLKARMYTDVVDLQPDAVIIYWDSDVSDQLVYVLDEQSTLSQYSANCVSVFTTIQNASRYMAVAGPSILTEGRIFPLDSYDTYWYKFDTLNQFRSINKNISETFHIPYIDLRGSFMGSIPSSWNLARWFSTSDGEHENERGTRILAREFGKVINDWLNDESAAAGTRT